MAEWAFCVKVKSYAISESRPNRLVGCPQNGT
jgi:hypothetical protein